jgi:ribosomal protein S18 acetylase RimI-like enzyme
MVRKAQLSDAERICEIIIYGWRNAYIDFLGEEALYKDMSVVKRYKTLCTTLESDHGFYVYEENGIVKGFMRLEQCTEEIEEGNVGELVAIYVEPYFKGRGIGSKLIQEAEKIAASQSQSEIRLWVLEKNHSSRKFYEKNGYKATEHVKWLDKFDQNEVRYVKRVL